MVSVFFKRAFWWRLYYYVFTDFFKGMRLKDVLFSEYPDQQQKVK